MSTVPTENRGEVYISDRLLWPFLEEQVYALDECDTPAEFIGVFVLIDSVNDAWRNAVFIGQMPYSVQLDKKIKSFFEKWVEAARQKGSEHKKQFRKAKKILAEWQAPQLTTAVGGRIATLTDAQAKVYREITSDLT